MNFTEESQLVKDFILLINNNKMTLDEVPNIFNLKDVVENVVNSQSTI